MKFTIYFLDGKLQVVTFTINGKEYATADIRESWGFKQGLSNEVQLVTSKTYLKTGAHTDCDDNFDNLIEMGIAERRVIETEPTFKEWNDWGMSYTTIQHDALIFANKEYSEKIEA